MARSAPAEPTPERPPEEKDKGERYLTLIEHLKELRYRVMVSAAAVVVGLCISAVFANRIIVFLEQPAKDQAPAGFQFQFIEPFELFSTYLKVSFFGGLAFGMPFIVYHTLRFVSPGLRGNERRWLYGGALSASALFLCGVAFAYFVALPPTMHFFVNFQTDLATPNLRISSYIDFVTRLLFWTGVGFETPLVMMVLGRLGVVSARQLLGWWRFAVLGSFIASVFIAPHVNPVTHFFVAGPLFALYFLGVFLVFLIRLRR
jgi:sec-independent protein translocase protein TatC